MTRELILVSQLKSTQLFKSITAHILNNPLIVSRYATDTGIKIDTQQGHNLTSLLSISNASYYFIADLSVHEHNQLVPEDIVAFLLANSDKCLNDIILSANPKHNEMSIVLFEFIIGRSYHKTHVISTFP